MPIECFSLTIDLYSAMWYSIIYTQKPDNKYYVVVEYDSEDTWTKSISLPSAFCCVLNWVGYKL